MNCHGTVTRDTGGGVTVPRPDPTRPISNYSSIYLTVGGAHRPMDGSLRDQIARWF